MRKDVQGRTRTYKDVQGRTRTYEHKFMESYKVVYKTRDLGYDDLNETEDTLLQRGFRK